MPRRTVLITAIAGDIAQGVARVLREVRPEWSLVGADLHDQHGGALLCDHVLTLPPASSSNYLRELAATVLRHQIDVVMPTSEAELRCLHSARWGSVEHAPLLGVSHAALEVGLDKLATAEFLRSIGVPGPWTEAADPATPPRQLPCIFKLRASAGSKGLAICHSAEDAAWHAAHAEQGLFQELLLPAEREVTCAVYRDRAGEVAVLLLQRRLAGGFTSWARVIDDAEASNQCRRVATALNLHGPINVQMRLTAEGPRIFEINPRLSSTVFMRHLIGFSDVAWMVDELDGLTPTLTSPSAGIELVRTQGGAVLRPALPRPTIGTP